MPKQYILILYEHFNLTSISISIVKCHGQLVESVLEIRKKKQIVLMANAGQSWATGPLFFLKTGCPNKLLVVLGNRATANFGSMALFKCTLLLLLPQPPQPTPSSSSFQQVHSLGSVTGWSIHIVAGPSRFRLTEASTRCNMQDATSIIVLMWLHCNIIIITIK